jgi:lauroyl/myristoyl acyltransferase
MVLGKAGKVRKLRKWKPLLRLRYRCEYLALRFFASLIPRLPRNLVLNAAKSVGIIVFHLDNRGRRLGRENLETAVKHGGLDLGTRNHDDVLKECYQNFARCFLDLFWFSRLNSENLHHWIKIENESAILDSIRSNRGAVFLTPHYGIFEWASLTVGLRGLSLDIVAQDFKNAALKDVISRARQCSGHRILSRQGAMLKLIRTARGGGNIAMLPDLNLSPQGAAVAINVFGVSAWMTAAHIEISRRCDAPMVIAICEPRPDGRAILRVLDVIHAGGSNSHLSRTELTQMVWDRIESAIRQRPELWLWMYRHWRYCPSEKNDLGNSQTNLLQLHDPDENATTIALENYQEHSVRRAA